MTVEPPALIVLLVVFAVTLAVPVPAMSVDCLDAHQRDVQVPVTVQVDAVDAPVGLDVVVGVPELSTVNWSPTAGEAHALSPRFTVQLILPQLAVTACRPR